MVIGECKRFLSLILCIISVAVRRLKFCPGRATYFYLLLKNLVFSAVACIYALVVISMLLKCFQQKQDKVSLKLYLLLLYLTV